MSENENKRVKERYEILNRPQQSFRKRFLFDAAFAACMAMDEYANFHIILHSIQCLFYSTDCIACTAFTLAECIWYENATAIPQFIIMNIEHS